MAKKIVSRCDVEVAGSGVTYFKDFTEDAREIRRQVKLMTGHAIMDVNPDQTFRINYVKPKGTPVDWEALEDETVTVTIESGERITFSPCSVLSVGEYTIDNENEVVQPIIFAYEDRTVE